LSWQVYSGFPLPLTPSHQGREKLFFNVIPILSREGGVLFDVVPSPLTGEG